MSRPIVPVRECPSCRSTVHTAVLGRGDELLDVVRCDNCGLVHALGHYAHEVLDEGYGARGQATDAVDLERKRVAIALYDRLTGGRMHPGHAGAHALDLGCNAGLLLDALAELGWRTEGVERSPGARRIAAEHHVVHDLDLEDDNAITGSRYELVTMTHVLEHMRRPIAVAGFVARHLADDGIAVIEVPNWNDAARPLWGKRYRPLEIGDHVCFFDRDSLRRVLEKGGLRLRTLWSCPQGATLVMPSLLTALDVVRSLAPWRRRANAGAMSARADLGRRAPGGLRARLLHALDRLDPALERLAGADPRWGANLVAIATR